MERLDKILSHLNYGSRKEVKEYIRKGYFMVNLGTVFTRSCERSVNKMMKLPLMVALLNIMNLYILCLTNQKTLFQLPLIQGTKR